jgi:Flp pilus assembly protein TadG
MSTWCKALLARVAGERGSVSLELVIIAPALLLILGVAIYAGRVSTAGQTVEQAASAAARTASIARTGPAAQTTGDAAARDSLTQQGLRCTSTSINVDTSGFTRPVGTPAAVTVTVTCVVNTSDLAFPGIPGSRMVTGTAVSPLDTYRSRT